MVARIGGEEFVSVLLNANEAQTELYANALLEAIRQSPILLENGAVANVTASMGGYVYSGGSETKREIYTGADRALYQAKASGRDRYVLYQGLADKAGERSM